MSHKYSFNDIEELTERNEGGPFIVWMRTGGVHIGYLSCTQDCHGWTAIELKPLGIRTSEPRFIRRNDIKHIVGFNGYVYPKQDDLRRHGKMLDIFELNDLVNKAGYEFM